MAVSPPQIRSISFLPSFHRQCCSLKIRRTETKGSHAAPASDVLGRKQKGPDDVAVGSRAAAGIVISWAPAEPQETEEIEHDGRKISVPRYEASGDGGDDCLEREVPTPAVLIEHAAVASEPEPGCFIADGSSVGCANWPRSGAVFSICCFFTGSKAAVNTAVFNSAMWRLSLTAASSPSLIGRGCTPLNSAGLFHQASARIAAGQVSLPAFFGRQFLIRPGQLLNSGSRGIAAHGQSLGVALHGVFSAASPPLVSGSTVASAICLPGRLAITESLEMGSGDRHLTPKRGAKQ